MPSGKYFKNAPKFKCSPQNNGIPAALLKQKLCESGMQDKYLSNYNSKIRYPSRKALAEI
jgi:hypothetical protein